MLCTLALVVILAAVAVPADAVTVDWVYVGNAGNPADAETGLGAVSYDYRIAKYEVTNAQYSEFLNWKAASDPLGLYNPSMGSDSHTGGITRSGSAGSYNYAVKPGFADKPVVFVSFFDALRFANWLSNGQGSANTETGAYTLVGGTATPTNGATVTRNEDASVFLTSEDEWYKAAYFNGTSYFEYPAGTDDQTVCAAPGLTPNTANCADAVLTSVGSYTASASPYGTFDQGGNVWEWDDGLILGTHAGEWGGAIDSGPFPLSIGNRFIQDPWHEDYNEGFRVASAIPEPDALLLMMAGVAGVRALRRTLGGTRDGPMRKAAPH
jgi:formylglycine-generating enzyme